MNKHYKNLITLVMTMLCFLASANSMAEPVSTQKPLKVYDDWGGDFILTDHNGFPLSLSDFAGKVVLLNSLTSKPLV